MDSTVLGIKRVPSIHSVTSRDNVFKKKSLYWGVHDATFKMTLGTVSFLFPTKKRIVSDNNGLHSKKDI